MISDPEPTQANRPATWFNISIIGLAMAAIFHYVAYTFADPDLWGHVKFGQDIRQAGRIIQNDPYSYLTQGQRWINHEWLTEVIFSWVYDGAGPRGLILLKVALSLLVFGLVYRHLFRQGLSPLRAGIILIVMTPLVRIGLSVVRPQLFTYLFFLLVLLLIHAAERGRGRWLLGTPLLFALWANLHGGFLAGLGIFLFWTLIRVLERSRRDRRPEAAATPTTRTIALVALASALATGLNPYGPQLLTFLLRTATVSRPEIDEWAPIRPISAEGAGYFLLLVVGAVGFVYSRRTRNPALVLFLCAAVLPWVALRHAPLFALAGAVLAGEHIADAWNRRPSENRAPARSLQAWLAGLSWAAALALVGSALPELGCIHLEPQQSRYPVRAVALLKQSGVSGQLVIYFDWGEYALWHLSPRIKLSLDGRRETVYPDAAYRENMNFMLGTDDWSAILRRPETDLVLFPKNTPAFPLTSRQRDWALLYEDALCGLFARQGFPGLERIRNTLPPNVPYDGKSLCFP